MSLLAWWFHGVHMWEPQLEAHRRRLSTSQGVQGAEAGLFRLRQAVNIRHAGSQSLVGEKHGDYFINTF